MGQHTSNRQKEPLRKPPPATPQLPDIEMFLVGPDRALQAKGDDPQSFARSADAMPRPAMAEAPDEVDQMRVRLEPGARVGQSMDEPRRAGFPEEILVTLHASPADVARLAVETDLLDERIPRLHIDTSSLRARRNELRWTAQLRAWPWSRRDAYVRLYGSPSSNVTVLTLSPWKPHRIATRSFLRTGMRAMTELRDRLDQRSERPARKATRSLSQPA